MSAGSSRKGAAIVTGASQGIGRAIALKLARDGYAIAVNDIPARREDVEAIVADLAKTGRAIAVLGDVSREQDIKAMIARTVEEIGELEVVGRTSQHATACSY
jgi:NAD(P)-dependent dehydrogenase (short-subunit alcohol dehydrogenase family)